MVKTQLEFRGEHHYFLEIELWSIMVDHSNIFIKI